jgi:threonine synthase
MKGDDPMLVVSTAHWAKFGADVYKALRGIPYAEPLPAELSSLSGVQLLAKIQALAPGARVPRPLAELDALPERFTEVVDAGRAGVEGAVRSWLERPR